MGSIYPDYEDAPIASHCIDGVTTYSGCTSHRCHPYLCLTADTGPHWLVISVTGYSVSKIVVYNRIDGSEYGIQSSINGAQLIYSNDFEGTSVIYQSSFGYTSSLMYTFDLSLPNGSVTPRMSYYHHSSLLSQTSPSLLSSSSFSSTS